MSERSFIFDVHLISGVKKKQATVSQEEASPWSEDSGASHASAEWSVRFPNNPVPKPVNAMTAIGSLHS
ncbi:Uncharacterised protein [Aeromonas salmonicida]|nr:Uncharacterised protein [Aeromonas salmonicida]SUU73739.1 Uncharacterised protein [Aeromonas salmonicida]